MPCPPLSPVENVTDGLFFVAFLASTKSETAHVSCVYRCIFFLAVVYFARVIAAMAPRAGYCVAHIAFPDGRTSARKFALSLSPEIAPSRRHSSLLRWRQRIARWRAGLQRRPWLLPAASFAAGWIGFALVQRGFELAPGGVIAGRGRLYRDSRADGRGPVRRFRVASWRPDGADRCFDPGRRQNRLAHVFAQKSFSPGSPGPLGGQRAHAAGAIAAAHALRCGIIGRGIKNGARMRAVERWRTAQLSRAAMFFTEFKRLMSMVLLSMPSLR